MKVSRLWLASIVALFALPLFIGLGRRDLANDEAIYSFGVDRILETGDWLMPRASPDDLPFFEKPPLKFWIVAAPIRAGLLPHDEFGLRFWDACFGGLAFVYVFLLASRLLNPLAGGVAVLALFAQADLLFDHGIRDNVMEASLVLAYCGATYHYHAWSSRSRRRDAVAVGLFFTFAFMVKFVAALFLPLIIVTSALLLAHERTKLLRAWRLWSGVSLMALALIAPWFVWVHLHYGAPFWHELLDVHVYRRFTAYLDPGHLEPWSFYAVTLFKRLWASNVLLPASVGLAALSWRVWRRQTDCAPDAVCLPRGADTDRRVLSRPIACVLLVWAVLPLVLLSLGTSKLYHYFYPFLPPYAIAAGYAVALAFAVGRAPLERAIEQEGRRARRWFPRATALGAFPAIRALLLIVAAASVSLGVASLLFGQIRIPLPHGAVLRNTGILRPALVAFLFVLPLGLGVRARRAALPLLVVSLLPLPAYRAALAELNAGGHPLRAMADCLRRVQQQPAGEPAGLRVVWPRTGVRHPENYYFRQVQPWIREFDLDPQPARPFLSPENAGQPVLIADDLFAKLPQDVRSRFAATLKLTPVGVIMLPPAYAACTTNRETP